MINSMTKCAVKSFILAETAFSKTPHKGSLNLDPGDLPTYVLIGLSVDQTIGIPPPSARHPEQERVGLDHVAVAGLELIAGDQ